MADTNYTFKDASGNTQTADARSEATNSELRAVIVLGDPATNAAVTAVQNSNPAGTEYGPVVREVNAVNINTALGAQADSAAAGDTSTASLIALFKRLLQRVTTLLSQLPAALTGSGNFKVSIAESTATVAANTAQVNGVTTSVGNGVSGTGVQRMAIASDNSAVSGLGAGATGSAVPANAVYKGGVAKTANPSAATDGNLVGSLHDKLGKQVVVGSVRDLKVSQKTTISSSTSETTIGTQVASTFLDLYGLIIANTSASACNVTIKDSTTGTTRFIIAVPAGETRGFVLNESAAHNQATVNTNWTATCSASVASIEITALFVKNI